MEDNSSLVWKLKKEEHVVQDEWIDFRRNDYELPNGEVIGPVYNYSKHSFSLIVATDENGDFICVRQYRHGIDEVTSEFPAGAIEYKEKSDVPYITDKNIIATEDEAFEAAKRELKEETGFVSDNWKHLLTMPANATLSNSNVHIYAAMGFYQKRHLRKEYLKATLNSLFIFLHITFLKIICKQLS